MVRRASSASVVHVPGVADAVGRYLQRFAAKWGVPSTLPGMQANLDALTRWELVVHSEEIWRAVLNPSNPREADWLLTNDGMWRITGPNTLETAE